MKPASDLVFCSCRSCRRGKHRGSCGGFIVKYKRHSFRRLVKFLCKKAKDNPDVEIPERYPVGYTD